MSAILPKQGTGTGNIFYKCIPEGEWISGHEIMDKAEKFNIPRKGVAGRLIQLTERKLIKRKKGADGKFMYFRGSSQRSLLPEPAELPKTSTSKEIPETRPSELIVNFLKTRINQPVNIHEVAAGAGLELSSTINTCLAKLSKANLVNKDKDPVSNRGFVYITHPDIVHLNLNGGNLKNAINALKSNGSSMIPAATEVIQQIKNNGNGQQPHYQQPHYQHQHAYDDVNRNLGHTFQTILDQSTENQMLKQALYSIAAILGEAGIIKFEN